MLSPQLAIFRQFLALFADINVRGVLVASPKYRSIPEARAAAGRIAGGKYQRHFGRCQFLKVHAGEIGTCWYI
jgi:hypothetical protein